MREHQLRAVLDQPGGPQRVRGAGRVSRLEPGQHGGVPQRRAGAEDRHRAGQRPGTVGQPGELTVDDPRDLLGPERPQPRRGLIVRGDAIGGQLGQQGAEQERVAAGDGVAGLGESGAGRWQALAHQRLHRRRAQRPRAHRRLRRAGQQLGEQVGRGRRLTRAHRAEHADRHLVKGLRQQRQPAQGRGVSPVDIIDGEHGWAAVAEVAGQPHQPAHGGMHGVARVGRLPRLGREDPPGQSRGARGQLGPVRAGAQRVE